MPVAAQLGGVLRHDDVVAGAGRDVPMAARAHVILRGLVGLHPADVERTEPAVPDPRTSHPRKAQSTRAAAITIAASTSTTSLRRATRLRYRLKPIAP